MKTILKSILSIASAAMLFSSCTEQAGETLAPSVTVDQTEVTLPSTGSQKGTIAVKADGDWVVTVVDCDWLTFSPTSGTGNGTVTVTATDNVDDVYKEVQGPRSTVLSVIGSESIAAVTVKQVGEGGLDASRTYKKITRLEDFDATKGFILVTSYGGKNYCPSLCTATSTSYQYIYSQEITVEEGDVINRPDASLAYTLQSLSSTTYALKQSDGKYLTHSAGYDSFYGYDAIDKAEAWTLGFDDAGHAILANSEGCMAQLVYKGTVEMTAKADAASQEDGYLPFMYIDSKAATDEVLSASAAVTVKGEATSVSIPVKASKSWKVRCHDSWVSSFTKEGSGNGTIEVTFPANTSYDEDRTAQILLLGETTNITIVLTQSKFVPELAVSATSISVAADKTGASFYITSNVAWSIAACDGVTIDPMKGNGNAAVNLTFAANTGAEAIVNQIKLQGSDDKLAVRDLVITLTRKPATNKELPYTETFAENMGDFTIEDVTLPTGSTYVWKYDSKNKYMKASAYVNSQNLASESWLVSPSIEIPAGKPARASVTFCGAYGKSYDDCLYAYVIDGDTKTKVSFEIGTYSKNWQLVTRTINLDAYSGKVIKLAIVYKSSTSDCPTIEVTGVSFALRSLSVKELFSLEKNTVVEVNDLTATLVYSNGFFAQDATSQILVYLKNSGVKVGDKVNVKGKIGAYSNQKQISATGVEVVSSGNTVTYPTPVNVDANAAAAFNATNPGNQYSTIKVNLTSEKTYEGTIDGGSTVVSIYYDSSVTVPQAGSSVNLEGYVYGWYNKLYFYAIKAVATAS